MQLVLHAPFGGRINRAWGMALRKRFCRTFDFELQAAATDDGVLLSLGPQHSFPLETIFEMLDPDGLREVLDAGRPPGAHVRDAVALERVALARAPALPGRPARAAAAPAHALRRSARRGLPGAAGCQDNHGVWRAIELPDHPLVNETHARLPDRGDGRRGLARRAPAALHAARSSASCARRPSRAFSRTKSSTPTPMPSSTTPRSRSGARAPSRCAAGCPRKSWSGGRARSRGHRSGARRRAPDVRNADELHDLLLDQVALPEVEGAAAGWAPLFEELVQAARALRAIDAMRASGDSARVLWVPRENERGHGRVARAGAGAGPHGAAGAARPFARRGKRSPHARRRARCHRSKPIGHYRPDHRRCHRANVGRRSVRRRSRARTRRARGRRAARALLAGPRRGRDRVVRSPPSRAHPSANVAPLAPRDRARHRGRAHSLPHGVAARAAAEQIARTATGSRASSSSSKGSSWRRARGNRRCSPRASPVTTRAGSTSSASRAKSRGADFRRAKPREAPLARGADHPRAASRSPVALGGTARRTQSRTKGFRTRRATCSRSSVRPGRPFSTRSTRARDVCPRRWRTLCGSSSPRAGSRATASRACAHYSCPHRNARAAHACACGVGRNTLRPW